MSELGTTGRPLELIHEGRLAADLFYESCVVHEAVNDLFTVEVMAISEKPDFAFGDFIGTGMCVRADLGGTAKGKPVKAERHFHGIVTDARLEGMTPQGHRFRFTLLPWLALGAHRRNQRIFHDQNVKDILKKMFADWVVRGEVDMDGVTQTYPMLEYTVQYGETDLDFVRRLMERFGISFYFTHAAGSHRLVLFDGNSALEKREAGAVTMLEHESHHVEGERFVRWVPGRRLTSTSTRLVDFDFEKPKVKLDRAVDSETDYAVGAMENYDYPGGFREAADGRDAAARGTRAVRLGDGLAQAEGTVASLAAGMTFSLDAPHRDDLDGEEFVCLTATHTLPVQVYGSGRGASVEGEYQGVYVLSPSATPIVPTRVTPRPSMRGPQTATVVVGLECDKYGRIKVRFHWDTDADHSMWCRVSQSWAGAGFGAFVLPRVGMEVIVEFLDGDPDRPIVTGCVYNDANMPPYELPRHATRSTFRTDTVEGKGSNELRFEDKKGAEEVFIHAQHDMNSKVVHDRTEHVNNNKVESVGRSKASEVGRNFLQIVNETAIMLVGESHRNTITPEDADKKYNGINRPGEEFQGIVLPDAQPGDWLIDLDRDLSERIGNDAATEIVGSRSVSIGGDDALDVGGSIDVNAAGAIKIKSGAKITLECGGSKIEMTPTGIKITAVKIDVESDAAMKLKAGAMLDVNAGAVLSLKGAALKLN